MYSGRANDTARHAAARSAQTFRIPQLIPPARDFDLRKILGRYPAPYQSETERTKPAAGGFSVSSIWKIETAAGPCALRGTTAATIDRGRLAGPHRLISHVRDFGIAQVPVPVLSIEGTTFFEEDGIVWQLEPWMSGVADFWARPGASRLASAMTCLARWHRAAARFERRDEERGWFF